MAAALSWQYLLHDSRKLLSPTILNAPDLERFAHLFASERQLAQSNTRGVLFLCGHNAGRSQISACYFNHLISSHNQSNPPPYAYSAGSTPGNQLNPMAVQAMDELGISMKTCFPKPWTSDVAKSVRLVITMGCGDRCPVIQGTECRDWNLPDPHGKGIDEVRAIRDEITHRVKHLVQELSTQNLEYSK